MEKFISQSKVESYFAEHLNYFLLQFEAYICQRDKRGFLFA
jgi:hypothetical protein